MLPPTSNACLQHPIALLVSVPCNALTFIRAINLPSASGRAGEPPAVADSFPLSRSDCSCRVNGSRAGTRILLALADRTPPCIFSTAQVYCPQRSLKMRKWSFILYSGAKKKRTWSSKMQYCGVNALPGIGRNGFEPWCPPCDRAPTAQEYGAKLGVIWSCALP